MCLRGLAISSVLISSLVSYPFTSLARQLHPLTSRLPSQRSLDFSAVRRDGRLRIGSPRSTERDSSSGIRERIFVGSVRRSKFSIAIHRGRIDLMLIEGSTADVGRRQPLTATFRRMHSTRGWPKMNSAKAARYVTAPAPLLCQADTSGIKI